MPRIIPRIIYPAELAQIYESLPSKWRKGYVYILECPDTGTVRYAGQTNSLRSRYSTHVTKAHLCDTPKRAWVQSLLDQGKLPVMRVVDVYGYRRRRGHSERDWIERLVQEGADLLNSDHLYLGIKARLRAV